MPALDTYSANKERSGSAAITSIRFPSFVQGTVAIGVVAAGAVAPADGREPIDGVAIANCDFKACELLIP